MNNITLFDYNGEKVAISTFFGNNRSKDIIEWQKKVFSYYDLPINHVEAPFERGVSYGAVINQYVNSLLEHVDYFFFFDTDAIPLEKEAIFKVLDKIKDKDTMWGISQQSTHILKNGIPNHPYAGFSTCAFSKELYLKLGKPTFTETPRGDIGEELTWQCEERGHFVCLSYPIEFHPLTDQEISDTGNAQHGWVNNGIKLGLGTTFAGPFYHSFHQGLNSEGSLAIPRSSEIFIEKAKQVIQGKGNRKLEFITGCVNTPEYKYSDILAICLPYNKKHFDNILVVTTEDDIETQKVCSRNGVDFYCTDKFFANGAKFDNNSAFNAGLSQLKHKDWIVAGSPDIIYPDNFRSSLGLSGLSEDKMYGVTRTFIPTFKDWIALYSGKKKQEDFESIEGFGCGFTQIFSLNSNKLSGNLEDTFCVNGKLEESDILTLKKFHPDVRHVGKLPINVLHLGDKGFGGGVRDGTKNRWFFHE
tara:strand:- start:10891 stop:12309 length:1419 start_codon:yes stop_codon:yes gene_type:complete